MGDLDSITATREPLRQSHENELSDQFRSMQSQIESLDAKNQDLQHSQEELLCIIEEIRAETGRLEAENAILEQRNSQWQRLLNIPSFGMIELGADLQICRFSKGTCNVLHVIKDDVGRKFRDLTTCLDISSGKISELAARVRDSGNRYSQIARTKEGKMCLVRIDQIGDTDHTLVTFNAAECLEPPPSQRFDEICQSLVSASSDVLIELSENGRVLAQNRDWEKFTGQDWPHYKNLGWVDAIDESAQKNVTARWSDGIESNGMAVLGLPIWSQEHSSYRLCSLRTLPTGGGKFLCAISDVDDLGSELSGAGYKNGLLESVFDNAEAGVLVTGIDGEVLVVNERATSLFDSLRKEDIIGRSVWDLMPDEVAREWRNMDEEVFESLSQRTLQCGNPMRVADGAPENFFVIKFPLVTPGTTTPHGIGTIITDITLQREGQIREREHLREVESVNEELEGKNRDLDEFAHMVSHDLKQPLRIIENYSCMLDDECGALLTTEAKSFLDRMQAASRRSCELIDATLNYARLGRNALSLQEVDLYLLVEEVAEDFKEELSEQSGTLHIGELPMVVCDPDMMYHVFSNLIGNAIKYRQDGIPPEVTISYEKEAQTGIPVILVTDNGIGMDPVQYERVFEPFKRLHSEESIPGTGIGLAITRKIVERHGGDIALRTRNSGGMVVRFTIEKCEILID